MCHPCVTAAQARLATEQPPAPTPAAEPAPVATAVTAPASVAASPGAFAAPEAAPYLPVMEGTRPGPARRIVRGMLWGLLYGQWWTLWTIISTFLWHFDSIDGKAIFFFLTMGVVYAFFGSLAGLIIGMSNAAHATGMAIGVGVGILVCLLEMLLTRNFGSLINLVFYYFTGRYVGLGITGRVQQPVPAKR